MRTKAPARPSPEELQILLAQRDTEIARLREQLDLLQFLFDTAPARVAFVDPQLRLVVANASYALAADLTAEHDRVTAISNQVADLLNWRTNTYSAHKHVYTKPASGSADYTSTPA